MLQPAKSPYEMKERKKSFLCLGLSVKFQTIMLHWNLSSASCISPTCGQPFSKFSYDDVKQPYIHLSLYQLSYCLKSKAAWLQWQQVSKFNILMREGKRMGFTTCTQWLHWLLWSLCKNVRHRAETPQDWISFSKNWVCNSNLGILQKILYWGAQLFCLYTQTEKNCQPLPSQINFTSW